MSDALNFLTKARPEAMGHYFSFLKDCGKHLDPKTRSLISVITKVHAQTERGFRQYLRRALRDGCSGGEVLDALLMAFPALGLAKIVWAVDLILSMDLPQFQLEALATGAQWHDVLATADLPPGGVVRLDCEGAGVFVHHHASGWRAFDSRCPHEGTDLTPAALQGHTLTCPKHAWAFDVRSGESIDPGHKPLREWDCKVSEERLLVRW